MDISAPESQQEIASALSAAHNDLRDLVGQTNVLDPFVVPGMLSEPAAQSLASTNRDGFLIVVTVDPNGPEVATASDAQHRKEVERLLGRVSQRLEEVPTELAAVAPEARGTVSYDELMQASLNEQVERDLIRGEIVSLPIVLLVMVLFYGGFLLAGMPLLGALVSTTCALATLFALSYPLDLQPLVVNVISVIGLGLSIDYGLLITSRYREELSRLYSTQIRDSQPGQEPLKRQRSGRRNPIVAECMDATLNTAGRTVLFSALTVAICLLGLLMLRPSILRTIALAGVAAVLVAVVATLTLVPALLTIAGTRLLHPGLLSRIPGLGAFQNRLGDSIRQEGLFSALTRRVNRHPWIVLVSCLIILLLLSAPIGHLHMLSSSQELLPPNSDQRAYLRTLEDNYPAAKTPDATVVIVLQSGGR